MADDLKFVEKFVRGADLPEGEPVSFTTKADFDGKVWGYQETDSEFAKEVMIGREMKRVEFFINVVDEDGLEKKFTRSSKSFWKRLNELKLEADEKINIIRTGEGKQARYSVSRAKK